MAINKEQFVSLKKNLDENGVQLVAVSKMQPTQSIMRLYEWGQRDFGENYVQELVEKEALLPKDIRWHFIGHLQSNKVKFIVRFVHLIHGVDSLKLLKEINKQGEKSDRIINVLLQIHIASEETKFGLGEDELAEILQYVAANRLEHVQIRGLMGMASLSDNEDQLRTEFQTVKKQFDFMCQKNEKQISADVLSTGMTADYKIAIEEGSTMVRLGSLLFGSRSPK